jgi:nucleoside 2-deoxyribosyltransferase
MKIYLAGPLGFSEVGREFHNRVLIPALKELGHEILDPWALTDPVKLQAVLKQPYGRAKRNGWRKLNAEIGMNNKNAIDASDAIFAVLDGVDVDSGTASEIGYGFAVGKPILGYRGDLRLSADNEGCRVNLQVEFFIRQSGGEIVEQIIQIPQALNRIRKIKLSDGP